MPFPFELPTTSSVSLCDHYISTTHPSLPLAATTSRGVLRAALKGHKRLPAAAQASNLPAIIAALTDYIAYLVAIDTGLSNTNTTTDQRIQVTPTPRELVAEWRPTLSASPVPGREPPRAKLQGLEPELAFALHALACAHSLTAREQLRSLFVAAEAEPAARGAAVSAAMRAFLDAHAVHAYLAKRVGLTQQQGTAVPAVPDVSSATQSALAELTLAEATLAAVLKDDPYPAVVAEERSTTSREWMVAAPSIPKVRAHLFARLCLAAGEHAARGQALLAAGAGGGSGSGGRGGAAVDDRLPRYLEDLRRAARGKAARFLGLDAELAGRGGEGIAWLRGARAEMGFPAGAGAEGADGAEGERKRGAGFSRLRKEWAEKREDKKIERGEGWGSDAGRFEESRIVEMLERKWVKMNDTISIQRIPPSAPLLATMPSGREYHQAPPPFVPRGLDADALARMRAPPDPAAAAAAAGADGDDDSGDEVFSFASRGSGSGSAGGGGYY